MIGKRQRDSYIKMHQKKGARLVSEPVIIIGQ
jgi:hypothetical protein